METQVTFKVNAELRPNQVICLIGNGTKLGAWNPTKAIQLGKKSNVWKCCVALDCNVEISYRYFVCKLGPGSKVIDGNNLDIVKWETHLKPRQFVTGNQDSMTLPVVNFGEVDGVKSQSKGWLLGMYEVHIRLHENPISVFMNDSKNKSFNVTCRPVDYSPSQSTDIQELMPCSKTEVLVSNINSRNSQPSLQSERGMDIHTDDYVIFRYRTSKLENIGCCLEIKLFSDNGVATPFGLAHLMPYQYPVSQRSVVLPVIRPGGGGGGPVGFVNADVLVVHPLNGIDHSMEKCSLSYNSWRNTNRKPHDVGHRGMGVSFNCENPHTENTVASFNTAAKFGADFIEADIVLTQEKCPVIYHDFTVNCAIRNKSTTNSILNELHSTPIRDLTLDEINSKKFYTDDGSAINGEGLSPNKDSEPFPTLVEILTNVTPGLGFDLEFKFPQLEVTCVMEGNVRCHDMNEYVDAVLKVIFQHAGDRPIFFSTFHADIAIMLKLKQNRFPVMFLSQGPTKLYTPYKDFRAQLFENGINFVLSEELLGLVLHMEVLLEDMSVIDEVIGNNLLLYLWGVHLNDTDLIIDTRKRFVDGIIYDRMDKYKPENANQGSGSTDDVNSSNLRRKSAKGDGDSPAKKQKVEQPK